MLYDCLIRALRWTYSDRSFRQTYGERSLHYWEAEFRLEDLLSLNEFFQFKEEKRIKNKLLFFKPLFRRVADFFLLNTALEFEELLSPWLLCNGDCLLVWWSTQTSRRWTFSRRRLDNNGYISFTYDVRRANRSSMACERWIFEFYYRNYFLIFTINKGKNSHELRCGVLHSRSRSGESTISVFSSIYD